MDARSPADYAAGHIPNAFNLAAEAFAQRYPEIEPMLTREMMIIVYCDGEQCALSHELLARLRQLGYRNVRVLVNGWTVWRQAHRPVTMGAQP